MNTRRHSTLISVLVTGLFTGVGLIGCGTEAECRAEEARNRRDADKERLHQVAIRHAATPINLDKFGFVRQRFTAEVQREWEGQRIAFWSTLSDVERHPDGTYRIALESPDMSALTWLETPEPTALELLAAAERNFKQYRLFVRLLVVAEIEHVESLRLAIRAEADSSHEWLELTTNLTGLSYRLRGRALAVEHVP